ncbi:MAG: Glu-tRNA(Gln) amidotransferase subunit GatE [Candidatus Aenigmarchaeota archaeon]|nr:Glu-tRNA(Gln) amidotransferase subunit GatE [Candidatus Aenigmarchaeota archaeon]
MDENWKQLGLKVGIEIHQELDSHKLFCSCPAIIRHENPDLIIKRKLRAAAGETEKKDKAALYEEKKNKMYIYEAYSDTNCLVETDSEPPHPMNEEALTIALQVAFLLNAEPLDEIHVMRKTVVDGSNTSGFQRTALIATDGFVEVNGKKIFIPTINIEEDAGRRIREDEKSTTFRLDRLGIAEVEIATSPDINHPIEVKEVAKKIGMILRSCKVRRGLGTIRQDINVSIRGGSRVEIKHVQNLDEMPAIVKNEVKRQKNLLEISKELKKITSEENLVPDFAVLSAFEHTKSKIIKQGLKNGVVLGVRLPGFAGFLGKEVQPGRRLGTELSDYAKIAGVSGIFHSDELPAYGITKEEVEQTKIALNCRKQDAFVIVVAEPEKASRALRFVLQRARYAINGVPNEVRGVEGTNTKFLRPMPGAARLYPETDIPPVRLTRKYLNTIKIPETIEEKIKKLKKEMPKEIAEQIIMSKYFNLFESIVKKFKVDPILVATTFTSVLKDLKRRGVKIELGEKDYIDLFELIAKKRISKDAIPELLEKTKAGEIKKSAQLYEKLSEDEIKNIVKEVVEKSPTLGNSALMGIVMKKIGRRADGKLVSSILKKIKKG